MFQKIVAVCLVFACTTAHANPQCTAYFAPEGEALRHGDKFYGVQPETLSLGGHTDPDLDLLTLTYPIFEKSFATQIGRSRFKHLLMNPLLNTDEIQARQRAVKALIENPEGRALLKQQLRAFQQANPVDTVLAYEGSGIDGAVAAALFSSMPLLSVLLTTAVLSSAVNPELLDPHVYVATAAGVGISLLSIFGAQKGTNQDPRWDGLLKVKKGLAHMRSMHKTLQGVEDSLLAEIEQTLLAVNDPHHPLSLTHLLKRLKLVPGRNGRTLAEMAWIFEGLVTPAAMSFRKHNRTVAHVLTAVSELDVMVGLAEFAVENPNYTFPEILSHDHPTYLQIENGYNPYVLANNDPAVPASITLAKESGDQFALLTGPNKRGKSTFLKMIGNLTLLAQIGAPVPATAMKLTPMVLLTSLSVKESLSNAESLFFAQSKRLGDLMKQAEGRSHVLYLMDEILTGTNPEMHTALEMAFIQKVSESSNAIALLATHDYKLQQLEGKLDRVANLKVEDNPKTRFHILRGPGRDRNAFEVVEEAGVPQPLVDLARHYYGAMEHNEAPLPPILKRQD